jgi:rhodanese-related sulfurtransferase
MERMGYRKVHVLQGGLPAWTDAGYLTVTGINVPSKAFGEKVHSDREVPEIMPEELKALREERSDLLILDVRTPQEYRRACIPGAANVPGGDLILWAETLRNKPDRTVVINCAGRTRSIVGTASLRRLGLTNVRALKNGTMGWILAGLEPERGSTRDAPAPPLESSKRAVFLAERLAVDESVPLISASELGTLFNEADRHVLYLVDVRAEEEYLAGHIPGSINVPGGQAVQRADDYIAVRNREIVFVSNVHARAVMAAYWYRQMGFPNVAALNRGIEGWVDSGRALSRGMPNQKAFGLDAARRAARLIGAVELDRRLKFDRTVVLDVGSSLEFGTAHVPGAIWLSRGWLETKISTAFPDRKQPMVVTCPDGQNSVLAASTLGELGYREVSVLDGGLEAWTAGGYTTEKGVKDCLGEPNDVVLSPSITGDKEAMKRYLDWEVELALKLEK